MSWSASASASIEELGPKLLADFASRQPAPSPDTQEQFQGALLAVGAIIRAVQPDVKGSVSVSLSGHANPGHAKTPGWSNDCVSISVTQT